MQTRAAVRLLIDWLDDEDERVRDLRELFRQAEPRWRPPPLRVLPEVRDAAWLRPSLPPSDPGYPGAIPLPEEQALGVTIQTKRRRLVCPHCGKPLMKTDYGSFYTCRSDKLTWRRAQLTTAPHALFEDWMTRAGAP
mgnify:FL=1